MKKKPRKIEAVFFDAGGTLIGLNSSKPFADFIEQEYGREAETEIQSRYLLEFLIARHRQKQFENVRRNKEPDTTGFLWLETFREAFFGNERLAQALFKWFMTGKLDTLYPDAVPILEWLKKHHISVGVLSNFSTTLKSILNGLGIAAYLDFIIVSSVVGIRKPNPRIFELAIERSQIPPDNILYVGNDPVIDIRSANNVGLRAVLIDRDDIFIEESCKRIKHLDNIRMLV